MKQEAALTNQKKKKKIKNLTEKLFKKSLIDSHSKILSKFKSDHSIKSKALKYVKKETFPLLESMKTYCLGCEKHAGNIGSKR